MFILGANNLTFVAASHRRQFKEENRTSNSARPTPRAELYGKAFECDDAADCRIEA